MLADLHESLSRDFRVDHITLQMGHCEDGDCANNCEQRAKAPAARGADGGSRY